MNYSLSEDFSGELFLKYENSAVSLVFGGEYFIQKSAPKNPIANYTLWLNTSVFPELSYLYTTSGWVEVDMIPIGRISTSPESSDLLPLVMSTTDYANLSSYDPNKLYILSDSGNQVVNTTSLTEENYDNAYKDANTLYVLSNKDTIITDTVALTQSEYDTIEVKDKNTLYIIVG